MPFSSGAYSLPANSFAQPVTGQVISSTAATATFADFTTAFSSCVLKDGTQTITGNLPMSSFKLTGLGAGSTAGDSVRYEQVLLLAGGTMAGNLLFTDATYDIGASGATRPRDLFLSRNAVVGGTLAVTGVSTLTGVATLTAQPILSALTASRAVATDASKGLVSLDAPITNSLSGDVALNNTGLYFTGPTVAQGTSGTWFASGTVTLADSAGNAQFFAKLWDGTTVIAESSFVMIGASNIVTISLSGVITSPAGNLRISVKDGSSTSGAINFNVGSNSKSSTLTAVRIA